MHSDTFAIYVFSFNRGLFLKNCIESIEKLTKNIKIYIIDDNSTDPTTCEILRHLSKKHFVIYNSKAGQYEHKTGGLAGSMNYAIDHAFASNTKYALFIQDDMQFVREFEENDIQRIQKYFDAIPNSIQLSANFVRRLSADGFNENYEINRSANAYIRKITAQRGKSNFSDTGIFFTQRVKEIFDTFEVGEHVNSAKAMRLNLTCGIYFHPFMCWLPYPTSFRGKRKSLTHRFFEYFGKSGYHPIRLMTHEEKRIFLDRNLDSIPVMEKFLISPNSPRHDVWSTGGGEYNFLAYGSTLSKVYNFTRMIKRKIFNNPLHY